MKNLFATLGLLAVVAVVAGLVCYRVSANAALHAAAQRRDAMEWLRADFHLSAAQMAEIKKLHDAYAPSCEEHCRLIQEATRARNALEAARTADPASVAAANAKLQELRATCETALARHVRQVAAIMAPEDGRRYLALVMPKIANFDHTAAPDLGLNRPS